MGDGTRAVMRAAGELLITAGLVVLLFCLYELQVTGLYTGREQAALRDQLQQTWTAPARPAARPAARPGPARPAAVPARRPPVPGEVVAVLHAPRLGRDWAPVALEGVEVEDLKRGPGHYPGTALPGQVGNVVFSGHRTTYGAPFADLDALRPGDALVVETRDAWYTYRVTGTSIVRPDQVEVTYPVPGRPGIAPRERLLTLTTCHPRYSARQRMVVQARLQGVGSRAGGAVPRALVEGV